MYKIMMNDIYKWSHERSWSLMKGFQCNTDKIHILKKTLMHLKNMNKINLTQKQLYIVFFFMKIFKKNIHKNPKISQLTFIDIYAIQDM